MKADFGAEIKRLRLLKGWTQEDVGWRMGWLGDNAGQTISHYENNRRNPSLHQAMRLFGFLGGSLDRFLGLADPPERRSGQDRRKKPNDE